MVNQQEREKYVAYFGSKLREHLQESGNALLSFPRFIQLRAEAATDQYLKYRPEVAHPCIAWDKALNVLLREFYGN